MKVFLLYKDRDFDLSQELPWSAAALMQDLELGPLLTAMADGDEFLREVAGKVIFSGFGNDPDAIIYRQLVLTDCMSNPAVVKSLYDISVEAIESRKTSWFSVYSKHPSSVLSSSIGMMGIYVNILKKLRSIADEHAGRFKSAGFIRFFGMLTGELTDEYFSEIESHLAGLRFREGILISARLGDGNKGVHYTLRKLQEKKLNWLQRLFAGKPPGYTFFISPRDESGTRALARLNDEGLNEVANALAQSNDHILRFFTMLRTELAFYLGALNLRKELSQLGEPDCFPVPAAAAERRISFSGLYDVCLALSMKHEVVGNDLNENGKNLVIITGANQGGKSTFLRSIGLAQLMMQSGMFTPAESFSANICSNLFTHFKREEDSTMKSGKFDEELARMSDITDHITPGSLLLFNESFAATNEREGSEIARQVVTALLEKGLKVFFVTHLFEFAHNFYEDRLENTVFLRAEREADTRRTFKLIEAAPLPTSYGFDLYKKIFETP
jgi:hypothetical protein